MSGMAVMPRWRRTVVTVSAAGFFISMYEVTILDSKYSAHTAEFREASDAPSPGARVAFKASAYCKGVVTSSGVAVQTGIAASDPELLPVGSVVQIESLGVRYDGIYTVLDTGPAVRGREIDLYMWSCNEALAFGRRSTHVRVLRLGWDPGSARTSEVRSQK